MKSSAGNRVLLVALAALTRVCAGVEDGLAVSSCSEVLLVSEKGELDSAGRALASLLEKPIDYYIGEEPAFEVTSVRASQAGPAPDARNVVICGVAASGTDVGRYIAAIIGDEGFARIRSEGSAVFKKENVPGPGQLTVIVAASSETDLMKTVSSRGFEIADAIESSCRERLRKYFSDRIDGALVQRLHDTYGFSLDVPRPYKILNEGVDPAGVQLLCEGPARLLAVSWFDWDRPPVLADSLRLFEARARYVWRAYDGDVMDSTRVAYRVARLDGYPAVEMSGYWSNSRAVAGGFYRTFFVYEPKEKLLWLVDLLVFAPGMPKHPLFRELYAIAESFRYD